MDKDKLIKKIVELEDERHYLQNLIEYAEENDMSVEDVISNKIAELYEEQEKLEA